MMVLEAVLILMARRWSNGREMVMCCSHIGSKRTLRVFSLIHMCPLPSSRAYRHHYIESNMWLTLDLYAGGNCYVAGLPKLLSRCLHDFICTGKVVEPTLMTMASIVSSWQNKDFYCHILYWSLMIWLIHFN